MWPHRCLQWGAYRVVVFGDAGMEARDTHILATVLTQVDLSYA